MESGDEQGVSSPVFMLLHLSMYYSLCSRVVRRRFFVMPMDFLEIAILIPHMVHSSRFLLELESVEIEIEVERVSYSIAASN